MEKKAYIFEIDTGAVVSSMSFYKFVKYFQTKKLEDTRAKLRTHTGEIIHPVGKCSA